MPAVSSQCSYWDISLMQGQVKVVQMVQEGTLLSWNEISQAERVVSDHLPRQSDFVWAAIGIVLVWFGSCLQHPHYIISVCAHVVNKKKLGENNKEIFSSKKACYLWQILPNCHSLAKGQSYVIYNKQ